MKLPFSARLAASNLKKQSRSSLPFMLASVGVVTMPFSFENTPRMVAAKNGIEKLKENVDTLLVIHNDKLLSLSDKPLMLDDAFQFADSVLKASPISCLTRVL